MKCTLALFAVAVSVCIAADSPPESPKAEPPQLTQEHSEKRDEQGRVTAYIDKFYRGNDRVRKERILQTVRFAKKEGGWGTWRMFYVDGKVVVVEADDGDGKPPTVALFKDNVVYEMFRRRSDGSVEPLSSLELARFRSEQAALVAGIEAVTDAVKERIETNSVQKVMEDLETDLQRNKQKQKNEGDNK
jgi:hypothetical protein